MKILVLGIGKMGYGLLKDLDAQPNISEIVAADINLEQAKRYSERVGGEKIEVRQLDVTDRHETVKLMREGFDVVASALPRPFCDAAAAAAIEVGIGYADVAASFGTIFNLDAAARRAGVTVVPHIGLDIGIDRVLCGVGARKLDKPERVHVWCGGFPQRGTPGYNNPLRYKISWYWPYAALSNVGVSRVLKDGEIIEIPRLSDPEEIVFPKPIGRCESYTTDGLLDVIEHLKLEGVKDAWSKTVRWEGHCKTWRKLIELHLLDEEPVRVKGVEVSPRDLFIPLGEKTSPRLVHLRVHRSLRLRERHLSDGEDNRVPMQHRRPDDRQKRVQGDRSDPPRQDRMGRKTVEEVLHRACEAADKHNGTLRATFQLGSFFIIRIRSVF